MQLVLTPELLIEAYRQGLFPMAYSAQSDYVHWICPEERGQLSIEALHIPASLKKLVRRTIAGTAAYDIRINTDFEAVIRACGEAREDRPETWINENIIKAYCALHDRGAAHSVEYWERDRLLGGLYGLSIGGAFFGESMYSRAPNASKIALVHLCARLWKGGYRLLDTQFVNDHLKQFGVYEVTHTEYIQALRDVLDLETDFYLKDLSETEILAAYFEFRNSEKI